MVIAFVITCATFAICTHEKQYENHGFDDDLDLIPPEKNENWTRTGDFDHEKISSALMMFKNKDVKFICNTNMITKNWFVTTAHCLNKVDGHENLIHLFIKNGVEDYRNDYGMDRKVERIIIHPYYNVGDFAFNIGLVEVDRDMDIDYGRYPFELLYGNDYPYKKEDVINVYGWGKNKYDDETEDSKLRAIQFYLIDNEDCKTATRDINRLFDNQICGYPIDPDSQICHPSEGAGVIKNGQLIAMSSWGERCIGQDMPHIFNKVEVYFPWIFRYVLE